MAVKPITNPFPVEKEQVDRSKQLSNRNVTNRSSNSEQTVIPGKDFTKNFEVDVKDLDEAIINHVNNTMNIQVNDNGEMVKVPIIYGNAERWANFRSKGSIRDKNGSLVLPLLMLKRTNIEFNDTLPSYKHDLTGENIQVARSSQWSKKNYYDRFSIDQGLKPVQERIVTGVPQFVNVNYDFVGWTTFIEQMNTLVESFSDQHNRYWGDNTSYRFLCSIGGGINDAVQMGSNTERQVRVTFSVSLKGYLLPEVIANIINKRRFNANKTNTKRKLVISEKIQ
jgi:hypothetical protein